MQKLEIVEFDDQKLETVEFDEPVAHATGDDYTVGDFLGGDPATVGYAHGTTVGQSVDAIAEGLWNTPRGMLQTAKKAFRAGNLGETDVDLIETQKAASEANKQTQEFKAKYHDAPEGLKDAMLSIPYSATTMAGTVAAGAATGIVTENPAAAISAGAATSGAIAYRASKDDFMTSVLDKTTQELGRVPTAQEWKGIADDVESEAMKYGGWEAGAEAIGNALFLKILGPGSKWLSGRIASRLGVESVAGRLAGSKAVQIGLGMAGTQAEELATETITQMGQGAAEANVGLREKAPTLAESFQEVAPATMWQTALMGAGGHLLGAGRVKAPGATVAPDSGDESFINETVTPNSRVLTPEVLKAGDVDLLDNALPVGQNAALPAGTGAIPMGTTETGIGPIEVVPDVIEQPAGRQLQALPETTGAAQQGMWPGGKMDLAYDWQERGMSPSWVEPQVAPAPVVEEAPVQQRTRADVLRKRIENIENHAASGKKLTPIMRENLELFKEQLAQEEGVAQPDASMPVVEFEEQQAQPATTVGSSVVPATGKESLQVGQAPVVKNSLITESENLQTPTTPETDRTLEQAGEIAAPGQRRYDVSGNENNFVTNGQVSEVTNEEHKVGDSWISPDGERKIISKDADGSYWVSDSSMQEGYREKMTPELVTKIKRRDAANIESRAKNAKQEQLRAEKELEAKKEYDDVDGFADSMPSIAAGRVKKTLNEKTRVNGDIVSRKQLVRDLVLDGAETSSFEEPRIKDMTRMQYNRATNEEQAAHAKKQKAGGMVTKYMVGDYVVTKTEYDYANYLASKSKDAAKVSKVDTSVANTTPVVNVEEPVQDTQVEETEASAPVEEQPARKDLGDHFASKFLSGAKYQNIGQARKEAGDILGVKVAPGTPAVKEIDEAIEHGVVLSARETIAKMRKDDASDGEIFKAMVDLYERQPNLSSRTSTSVAQQAYSTPAPIAFLASRLAGIGKKSRVYEPTAGNGMLIVEANNKTTFANELNKARAQRLGSMGFNVTTNDASAYSPGEKVDVVIANPPFGRVRDEAGKATSWSVAGIETSELDQAIALKALESLDENGRAVLIIGGKQGSDATRKQKYNAGPQRKFYKALFDNYEVVDHFSVNGDLYSRQGASYPIDVIVINGRGKTEGRKFPAADLPRMYNSFEELEGLINERPEVEIMDTGDRADSAVAGDSGVVEGGDQGQGNPAVADGEKVAPVDSGRGRSGRGSEVSGSGTGRGGADRPVSQQVSTGEGRQERDIPVTPGTRVVAEGLGSDGKVDVPDSTKRDNGADAGARRSEPDGVDKRRGKRVVAQKETEFQKPYSPKSDGISMGTLVPKNMAQPVSNALSALEQRRGNIDDYVAKELGYKKADLYEKFAGEQIDAIGLAIDNIDRGAGFIIGDQTGIGKGRVNAAIIKYAGNRGLVPVFVTMKPDLYADMIRDLSDIGVEGFEPLVTNSGLTGDKAIPLPDGRTLKTKGPKPHDTVLSAAEENGVSDYGAVFTTYAQLASVKGQDTSRRKFLRSIAHKSVFILDESHNAGGGSAGAWKKKDAVENVAEFVRSLLGSSPHGTFYSSATYAKRPDVMSLYFKTDMRHAVDDIKKLADAISEGGIPMQQIVAAMLTESGQYIRRERSFEGASVDVAMAPVPPRYAESSATIMRAVLDFDRVKQAALAEMNDEEAGAGNVVKGNKSAGEGGMSSVNFAATMHNLISQSLLIMKADAAVNEAAEAVRRGEKPVITLANTMGSFIGEYAADNGLKPGDEIELSFKDLFIRYLDKTRMLTKKDADGEIIEQRLMTDAELGPNGVALYKKALKAIDAAGFDNMPLSPIDYISNRLNALGVSVGEITGRTNAINYSSGVPVYKVRKASAAQNIETMRGFNGGTIDVMILNQSGSTGISLHSSSTFKDQRKRTMIIAQPELNIDVFMQTLGRVFRTGQVVPPAYKLLTADIPAEKRPAAVLGKKMAGLNANTTASRKADTSFSNIPDFLNEYGDRVVAQIMADDPDLHRALGEPLKGDDIDGAVRRVTGRIPILPLAQQKALYERIESEYNELIAQVEALGGSTLEAKTLKLDAKMISSEMLTPAKDVESSSPFASESQVGEFDVKKVGKPFTSEQVREQIEKGKSSMVNMEEIRTGTIDWLRRRQNELKEDEAKDAIEQRTSDNYKRIYEIMDDVPVGAPVMVFVGEEQFKGIVTRIDHKAVNGSPVAPSSWKITVAVADAAKQLTFPFSKVYTNGGAPEGGVVISKRGSIEAVFKAFDSGQTEGREKRLIAFGNILSAYSSVGNRGQIVNFEDSDGNIRPGIIFKREATMEELTGTADVSLGSFDDIVSFINATNGEGLVKSADGDLSIVKTKGDYKFSVAASKSKGAKFFLNGKLLAAAGNDFVKSGNLMVMTVDEATAGKMVGALRAQGFGLVAGSHVDKARELQGEKKAQPEGEAPRYFRAKYQRAYHGSPHRFEKFMLEHIGNGEGAQAYGWGLYFAGKKEVAEWYREGLSTSNRLKIQNGYGSTKTGWFVTDNSGSLAGGPFPTRKLAANLFNINKGQLYEVEIPDEDVLLHWDKPLSEQPEKVLGGIENLKKYIDEAWLADTLDDINADFEELTGREFYKLLGKASMDDAIPFNAGEGAELATENGNHDQAASLLLNDDGIKGIKYLDGTSRSAGEGSYNYVIFDDNAIEMLKAFYRRKSESAGAAYSKDQARADAAPLLELLGQNVKVEIVQNIDDADLPRGLRKQMVADNAIDVMGVHYAGKNYLLADNIGSKDDLVYVLKHELFHDGLRRMRGRFAEKYGRTDGVKQVDLLLEQVWRANKKDIEKLRDAYRHDFPNLEKRQDRLGLTEEWLAFEASELAPRWYDRYVAAIAKFLRSVGEKLGIDLNMTPAEVREFIGRVMRETGPAAEQDNRTRYSRVEEAGAKKGEEEEAANLWQEMGTESPYFKKWSGGAPVVRRGEQFDFQTGKSVVVEADHGSPDIRFMNEDAAFKSEKERYGIGRTTAAHWFSTDNQTARTYADPRRAFDYQNAEPGVIQAFVRLDNPLVINAGGQNWRDAQRRGKTGDVISEARSGGHDGVIIKNVKDDYNNGKKTKSTTTLTVFDSKQIKSVFNRGTFDANDPRISYARPLDKETGVELDEKVVAQVLEKFDTKDLKSARLLSVPHWIAKKYPSFKAVYDRQLQRSNERVREVFKAVQGIPSLFGDERLTKEELKELGTFLWEYDGKKPPFETADLPKFLDIKGEDIENDTTGEVRPLIEKNTDWDAAYKKWVRKKIDNERIANAVIEIRMALDDALVTSYNRMARMSEFSKDMIAALRTQIGHVNSYMPHHRYGEYGVAVYGVDEETGGPVTLYREHFDAFTKEKAKKLGREKIAELKKKFPEATRFWAGKNTRMPEEVMQNLLSTSDMVQVLESAVERSVEDKQAAREIVTGIADSAANILKERGWGKHAIGRQNIPGFEKDDIQRLVYDYLSGMYGWITKMDAARDMVKSLNKIDAKHKPGEYSYTKNYVRDMLRNYDETDRLVGNIRAAAYVMFLGANVKSAVVNLTQNMVIGAPELSMKAGFGGARIMKAMADLVGEKAGRKTVTVEERRMLTALYEDGTLQADMLRELQGQISGSTWGRAGNKVLQTIGKPMEWAEKANRASLALAAFRAGKGKGMDYEKAMKFAEDLVRDAHFVYGRSTNMPEAFRGPGKAGRVAGAAYTFRTFNHNMLLAWYDMLKGGHGAKGFAAFAQSMGAVFAIGGLSAMPFYSTLALLLGLMTDDDEEPAEKIAKQLPADKDWLKDIIVYGMPSVAGINLGGSMRLEAIGTDSRVGANAQERIGSIVSDIIGVPGALVGMAGKSAKAAKEGEIARAVEELSPVFVKNIMASYRIATTGAYTLAGKPINGPGEIGPRKFDKPDAARKAMGFQPLSVSKDQDRMDAMQRRQALLSDKKEQFANRARRAFTEQNWEALNAQARGIMRWNKEQIDRGRPDMVIKPDVIKNAIKGGLGRQLNPGEMFRLKAFEKNMGADKKE